MFLTPGRYMKILLILFIVGQTHYELTKPKDHRDFEVKTIPLNPDGTMKE